MSKMIAETDIGPQNSTILVATLRLLDLFSVVQLYWTISNLEEAAICLY